MRRLQLTSFAFASLALASCSSSQPGAPEGPAAESVAPIVYGTTDTTHTAVVAVLGGNGSSYSECSGTIVQVANGHAYVLTAAHCCNTAPIPSLVVMANDYAPYAGYIGNANPPAPAYAVVAGSVKYDPLYNQQDHDFCMLQFVAPANTPVIPVALPGQDGLAVGTQVEYVGFGTTESNPNNSVRRHATATVDQSVTSLIIKYSEGGSQHIGGPCEGDSGGPALVTAGAAQSTQKVVATTSYGDANCVSYGVSSRVSSETGPGGFISTYLGSSSSSSSSTSSTSTSSSSSSGGGSIPTTCGGADGYQGCCADATTIYFCAMGADPASAPSSQACTGGKVCGWNATKGYYGCVTPPGGGDPSNMYPQYCGGGTASSSSSSSTSSTSSSTSSSSGGSQCAGAMPTGDATCDACLDASCCAQLVACTNDATCAMCASSANPPASCNTNQPLIDLLTCFQGPCNAQCNSSSSSSSSSSGSTSSSGGGSSTTSGGSTSSGVFGAGGAGAGGSAGSGASGTGNSGTGNSGTGASHGNTPGTSSGCNVASTGGGAPASPASLAGLLLGAALVVSRRRR